MTVFGVCAGAATLGLGLRAQARRRAEADDDARNWDIGTVGSWVFGGLGDG